MCFFFFFFLFFFQAEDGIRDDLVTGVQTCALPIWFRASAPCWDFYNYEYRVRPAEPAVVYCIKDGDYFYRAYSSRSSAETALAETCFNEGSRVIKFKEVMDDE